MTKIFSPINIFRYSGTIFRAISKIFDAYASFDSIDFNNPWARLKGLHNVTWFLTFVNVFLGSAHGFYNWIFITLIFTIFLVVILLVFGKIKGSVDEFTARCTGGPTWITGDSKCGTGFKVFGLKKIVSKKNYSTVQIYFCRNCGRNYCEILGVHLYI